MINDILQLDNFKVSSPVKSPNMQLPLIITKSDGINVALSPVDPISSVDYIKSNDSMSTTTSLPMFDPETESYDVKVKSFEHLNIIFIFLLDEWFTRLD